GQAQARQPSAQAAPATAKAQAKALTALGHSFTLSSLVDKRIARRTMSTMAGKRKAPTRLRVQPEGKAPTRLRVLSLRISSEELEALQKLAKSESRSISNTARRCLREQMGLGDET